MELTTSEAALKHGIPARTLRTMFRLGKIKGRRVTDRLVMLDNASVQAAAKARKTAAATVKAAGKPTKPARPRKAARKAKKKT